MTGEERAISPADHTVLTARADDVCEFSAVPGSFMTDLIGSHLAHLRAVGRAPTTIESRERHLLALQRGLPVSLDEANTAEIEEWLGRDGWALATRAIYWWHTVDFYRWAVTSGKIDFDPTEQITRPPVRPGLPRPVSADQLRTALSRLRQPWRLAVLLAALAGMRACEVANCRREDFQDGVVIIKGKGGRWRAVPLVDQLWVAVRDLPPGLMFRRPGGLVDGHWISKRVAENLDHIGLPEATLHRFRHWFGTVVQREYRDLRVTQELLGHASPATTAGYAAVTDGQRRNAIATLAAAFTTTLTGAA